MGYTNSPLTDVTMLSPNHSGQRTHKIDRITPHCVVGQCTAKRIGEIFLNDARDASCNYGIGKDGDVVLVVEEKNRSWCTSSNSNDQRAITIEVASDSQHPYAFRQAAYDKLIELCVDICKRNGLKKVLWFGDKEKSLNYVPKSGECVITVHRWYANKSCPGDWLYSRLTEFASEINARLGNTPTQAPSSSKTLYRVQTGAYKQKANADAQLKKVKAAGFDTYMVQSGGLYKIQVGAYSNKANADAMAAKLKAAGFDTYITTEQGKAVSSVADTVLNVGDKVTMQKNAPIYGKTTKFSSFVYDSILYVRQVDGDRIVVSTQKSGAITGAVDKKYLTKV